MLHNIRISAVGLVPLLLVLCVLLSACAVSPKREIRWQEYPFTIRAQAQCRERFGDDGADILLTATAPGEGELEFVSPESLRGLCISVHGGEGEMRLGELSSKVSGGVLSDVLALFSVTALDTERMTDICLEDDEGRVNVAQITLCIPKHASEGARSGASDGVDDDVGGAGGGNGIGAYCAEEEGEAIGVLTVRIDSETGHPLDMQADFFSDESLLLKIDEYIGSSDG